MPRLQFLFVLLAAGSFAGCGGYGSSITQPNGRPPNSISIVAGAQNKGTAAFSPNPFTLSIATGTVVTWYNDDQTSVYGTTGVTHDITADDASFASGPLAAGATFAATFSVQGTYQYHCSIHPTMTGTITVTP